MATGRRHKAREVVLQMLFQQDLNTDMDFDTVRRMIQDELRDESLSRFAWTLFSGTMELRGQLDEKILSVADNWAIHRMAPTDRNILRLGAFELLHTDTPPRVVINESLELAKSFGGANSASFVNGLLDRLMPREKSTHPPKKSPPVE